MRRLLAASVGLLLLAACSKGASRPAREPSPSPVVPPSAVTPVSPGSSPAPPSATASPRPAASAPSPRLPPSPTRRPTITLPSSPAVRLPVQPESVRHPAEGDYVYDLTGSSGGAPVGAEQPYPPGATQTFRVGPGIPAGGGTEYETVQTSAQAPSVRTTVRTRWEPGGVRILSTVFHLVGSADHTCAYQPPPEILHLPPRTETFPQQSFSGDCRGTVDVSVTGPETVTAVGRAWRTWRVHTTSRFTTTSGLAGTLDATTWLAPELGQPVKTATVVDAEVAGTHMSARQTAVLRSHP